jgi:ribosomal-protein-alanine N-acetyltransferase
LNLNFQPFPVLYTPRTVLRELQISDDQDIFKLRSNPSVNQYLDRPLTQTIQEARDFINKIKTNEAAKLSLYWIINLKESDEMIGTIVLWNIDETVGRAEVGFELLPNFQHRGLMYEALECVLNYGFEVCGFNNILAFTGTNNKPSINLLTKAGFDITNNYNQLKTATEIITWLSVKATTFYNSSVSVC